VTKAEFLAKHDVTHRGGCSDGGDSKGESCVDCAQLADDFHELLWEVAYRERQACLAEFKRQLADRDAPWWGRRLLNFWRHGGKA
jgi:hypothetical protein